MRNKKGEMHCVGCQNIYKYDKDDKMYLISETKSQIPTNETERVSLPLIGKNN